jgi:hypothetical protein
MLKAQGREESPYERTLNALERLLQDPNFLETGDMVQIAQFGQTITSSASAVGPTQVADLLRRLRRVSPSPDTNFDAVFADLLQALGSNSQYDRQVVIIASDFAHDPAATPPKATPNIADWEALFSRRKSDLVSRFSASSKIPLVLFRSPASGWEATVRDQVLKDLAPLVPAGQLFDVGAGGSSAEQLAAGIKKALLFDLDVAAELKPGHLEELAITIKNLNCISVDLASVKLICPPVEGAPQGASIPIPIEAGKAHLDRRGAKDTQILNIPKSTVPCGDNYNVAAETTQGSTGSAKATNRTWMKYNIEKILLEENLLRGSIAHIIIKMRGLYIDAHSYGLTVESKALTGKLHIAGTIAAPHDLDPSAEKRYRVTVPITKTDRDRLLTAPASVLIDSAEPINKDTPPTLAEREESQSWTNGAQMLDSAFLLIIFLFLLIYKKSTVKEAMGFASEMGEFMHKAGPFFMGGVALLNPIVNLLRPPFVRALPLSVADGIKDMSMFIALFLGVSLSGRAFGTARLIRDVYRGRLHHPDQYAKRVKAGWRPWLYGFLFATLSLTCVIYFTPKSEIGPIAKIQPLDVVPD